ncbi:MFS transporter [Endozoicomonadaceae bacterium StTr2]
MDSGAAQNQIESSSNAPALLAALIFQGAGQTVLIACLPLLVTTAGLSYPQLIGVMAAGMIVMPLAAPGQKRISHWLGQLRTIRLSLLMMGCSYLLQAITVFGMSRGVFVTSTGIALLLVAFVMYGLCSGGLNTVIQEKLLGSAEEQDHQQILGKTSVAINAGRVLGALMGLFAVLSGPASLLLALAGIGFVLTIGLSVTDKLNVQQDTLPVMAAQQRLKLSPALSQWPLLLVALFVAVFAGMLQFGLSPLLALHVGFEADQTAALVSGLLIAMSGLTVVAHQVRSRLFAANSLRALQSGVVILLVAALFIAGAVSLQGIAAGLALSVIAVTFMMPVYTTMIMESLSESKGSAAAVVAIVQGVGYAMGGLITGLLLEQGVAWLQCGLVSLALVLFMVAMLLLGERTLDRSFRMAA